MKRLVSVILIGILLIGIIPIGSAECDVCTETKVFYGDANFLIAKSDKRIIGVKSPNETQIEMLKEIQTNGATYPRGFISNGILRHKALALVKHYNGYASSMTLLQNITVTIGSKYIKEVEHIVRRKVSIFYGIPEEEVTICPETIILATLYLRDIDENTSYAGHIFFTSDKNSLCIGTVTFCNGLVAYLHMQDFDCDNENDLGFIPGWQNTPSSHSWPTIIIVNNNNLNVNVGVDINTNINNIIVYNVPYCSIGMEYWKVYEKEYKKFEYEVNQSSSSYSKSSGGIGGLICQPVVFVSGESFSSSQSSVKVTEESYSEKSIEHGKTVVK